MGWPEAAVIITTIGAIIVALLKWQASRAAAREQPVAPEQLNGRVYARATDVAAMGARVAAIEQNHRQFREDLNGRLDRLEGKLDNALKSK